MTTVTIPIQECDKCPSIQEYRISDYCYDEMPSVNTNTPRRLISDIRDIPVWCPRRIQENVSRYI